MKKMLLSLCLCAFSLFGKAAVVDTLLVNTTYLATPESVIVITPDAASEKACPTVYLLNGFGGNHTSWLSVRPDLPEIADTYGLFFVMPDGRNSWYWDSPIDPAMQMESFMTKDLVPYIDSLYNTVPEPAKRAVTGLSMGGHGAMWLAFNHPEIWLNVGATSGGLDIRPFPERWTMKERIGSLEENPEVWESHTVINLVPALESGKYNIIFDCGVDDFFFDVNNNVHQAMLENKIPHDYIVRPGAHNGDYWKNAIVYQLMFFNDKMNK